MVSKPTFLSVLFRRPSIEVQTLRSSPGFNSDRLKAVSKKWWLVLPDFLILQHVKDPVCSEVLKRARSKFWGSILKICHFSFVVRNKWLLFYDSQGLRLHIHMALEDFTSSLFRILCWQLTCWLGRRLLSCFGWMRKWFYLLGFWRLDFLLCVRADPISVEWKYLGSKAHPTRPV